MRVLALLVCAKPYPLGQEKQVVSRHEVSNGYRHALSDPLIQQGHRRPGACRAAACAIDGDTGFPGGEPVYDGNCGRLVGRADVNS